MKFAKETLPIVYDKDETYSDEDSVNAISIGLDQHSSTENEKKALIQNDDNFNNQYKEKDGEDSMNINKSCHYSSDKRHLMRQSSHSESDSDGEDLDFQSDSRYTSSYVTENTEDSLRFDNRVSIYCVH